MASPRVQILLLEEWNTQFTAIWGAGVRKNTLMVLSHLVLNDMMKVKGHIARLALCLCDPDPRISALAALFFHELAAKASKVSLNTCGNALSHHLSCGPVYLSAGLNISSVCIAPTRFCAADVQPCTSCQVGLKALNCGIQQEGSASCKAD